MIIVLIIAIVLLLILFGACFIAFNATVWRKQIKVPDFIMKIIVGEPEVSDYDKDYCRAYNSFTKLNHKREEMVTPDGEKIIAHILVPEKSNGKLLVACHGARSSGLGEFVFLGQRFYEEGYTLLMPDHRGCGESDGKFLGYGTHESCDTYLWVDYAKKNFPELDLYLLGISMGGATVLMMSPKAKEYGIKAIVADCSYTSAWNEFSYHLCKGFKLPEFPIMHITNMYGRIFAGYDFRDASPLKAVKNSSVPILFIHGTADDFVPFYMMAELYNACTSSKQKLEIKDAVHARAFYTAPEQYFSAVEQFFNESVNKDSLNK